MKDILLGKTNRVLGKKYMNIINERVGIICRYLLLGMTILGALNAILRYLSKFMGQPLISNAFLELQWYFFGAIFMLGASYSLAKDKHVRVDILYSNCSKKIQKRIDLCGTVLFLLPFCVLGIWLSWDFVLNSWSVLEKSPDSGGLPRYPIKTVIPLGFLLLFFQGLIQLQQWKTDGVENA